MEVKHISDIEKSHNFMIIESDDEALKKLPIKDRCDAVGDLLMFLTKAVKSGYDVNIDNPKCIIVRKEIEMELTKNQIAIMKHTISGSNRNWFGTSFNCQDSEDFEKLVDAGLATKEAPPSWMGDDVIYRLTDKGRKLIK